MSTEPRKLNLGASQTKFTQMKLNLENEEKGKMIKDI